MIHLCVAHRIMQLLPIAQPAQFMLGAMAPDAVHTRENLSGQDKYHSHLCVGEQPWGQIADNAGWRENVRKQLDAWRGKPDWSIHQGYCAHILTDVAWNEQIYRPMKAAHPQEFVGGWESPFHDACNDVDVKLYHQTDHDAIWALLHASDPIEISGLITQQELSAERASLLTKYATAALTGTRVQSTLTTDQALTFIEQQAPRIVHMIQ